MKFSDLQKHVEFETVYTPNPANRGIYDKIFGEFVTYYQQTKDIYKRLNS